MPGLLLYQPSYSRLDTGCQLRRRFAFFELQRLPETNSNWPSPGPGIANRQTLKGTSDADRDDGKVQFSCQQANTAFEGLHPAVPTAFPFRIDENAKPFLCQFSRVTQCLPDLTELPG